MADGYRVTFFDDPATFLASVGDRLAAEPVTSTVVATVAERMTRAGAGPSLPYSWFATVAGPSGEVVGIAMRTAPFPPYPPYLLEMPEEAAVALADALLDRGEEVGRVHGALPATQAFAERLSARTGGPVGVGMHTRLFELGALKEPAPARGRLRPAYDEETPLVLEWFEQFHLDADEQAGREGDAARTEGITLDDVRARVRAGVVWMWVDDGDTPRHLTAANPPAYGVVRIGPVFTPKEHRGRGYASAAVAEVSRRTRDAGNRAILFTDQGNPTSNGIYLALGYVPVVDMVELTIG